MGKEVNTEIEGEDVRKEDNGGGGDRKRMIGENEMLMLFVCPRFFSGSIISMLNVMPEKGKEEGE